MNVTQLSQSGFQVDGIFSNQLHEQLLDLNISFANMYARPGDTGFVRETFVIDGANKVVSDIIDQLTNCLNIILQTHNQSFVFKTIELWRDYPGYANGWHYDDPGVENFCIVYLDDGVGKLGTHYQQNNQVFSVSYKKNSAIILLDSNQLEHGMIGTVPADTVRRTLYINWKLVNE